MFKRLKDRKFKISLSVRNIVTVCLSIVLMTVTCLSAVYSSKRTVTITDGENPIKKVTTFKTNIKDVLDENGFVLNKGDKLSADENVRLTDGMNIEIYRVMSVSVVTQGQKKEYQTTRRVVGEILSELGIAAKDTDKITPGYYEKVGPFSNIHLVRLSDEKVSIKEEIPYESIEKVNKSLAKGTQKIIQNGSSGEKEVIYKISYEDGKEISREKIGEKVTKEPVKRITEVPERPLVNNYLLASNGIIQTARSGELVYSKVLSMHATAYDASSCGKVPGQRGYGITATGMQAQYGVVAVDPRVIPLGSKLYIEAEDGSFVYGNAIAADTGGAIKGNRIDLCYNTNREAINFGRRNVKVYVLK